MNKQINITHNGETYTLEFTRTTVKMLEQNGFKYEEFLDKPMSNVELAFTAAFIKNHPKIQQITIDEIYDSCKDKDKLIASLKVMIDDCYESLLRDPEDDSGNTTWEMVDLTPKKKVTNQG